MRVVHSGPPAASPESDLSISSKTSAFRFINMNYRDQLVEQGLWSANDSRDPSADIAAAWELEEKLEATGWLMRLHRVDDGWSCYLHHRESWVEVISGVQPTAALAIARAALQKEKLMTASELSLIKERNLQRRILKARATTGSYRSSKAKVYAPNGDLVADMSCSTTNSTRAEHNAAFLAHARNDDVEGDVDRLVAEVEQLQDLLSRDQKENN